MANWETNEVIISFVLNNIILLVIIQRVLDYICKKTPWAGDDDLPSFFGGLIDLIKTGGKK